MTVAGFDVERLVQIDQLTARSQTAMPADDAPEAVAETAGCEAVIFQSSFKSAAVTACTAGAVAISAAIAAIGIVRFMLVVLSFRVCERPPDAGDPCNFSLIHYPKLNAARLGHIFDKMSLFCEFDSHFDSRKRQILLRYPGNCGRMVFRP